MNDHRHAGALTDGSLDRDIARALAVDPSPEFVARVRTAVAHESPSWIAAVKGCATFSTWRRASALQSPWFVASVAAAVVVGVVVIRSNRPGAPANDQVLAARAIGGQAASLPYVGSAFRRTYNDQTVHPSLRAAGPAKAGPHALRTAIFGAVADPVPLLDPRETRALRALIAGVRDSRVDLTSLLRPAAPAPMELPPVDDLVIAPLAIEPLAPPIAPFDGAQGERQ